MGGSIIQADADKLKVDNPGLTACIVGKWVSVRKLQNRLPGTRWPTRKSTPYWWMYVDVTDGEFCEFY